MMWIYAIIILAVIVGIVWWVMKGKDASSGGQAQPPKQQ